jgi:hypothetical protein
MRSRGPLIFSLIALAVALATSAPVGAATRAVRLALFAQNAGSVDGIKASRSPMPGQLVALDRNGHLRASTLPPIGDAVSVGGLAASATPTPGELLALPTGGVYPASAIPLPQPVAAEVGLTNDVVSPPYLDNGPGPGPFRWDRVVFDPAGMVNLASGEITVPVGGYYLLAATVGWGPDRTPGNRDCEIGTSTAGQVAGRDGGADGSWMSFSGIAHLAAGSTVNLGCAQSSVDPVAILAHSGDVATTLSIILLAADPID